MEEKILGTNYYREYKNKLMSAEEAVKVVKSGDWVAYSHFALFPRSLDKALAQRKDELTDVKVRGVCALYEAEIANVDPKYKHFIYHSGFLSYAEERSISRWPRPGLMPGRETWFLIP